MALKFRWESRFKETEFGEIPRDWEERKVGEIGIIGGGTTPSTKVEEYWHGNIPWITPNDLAHHEYVYISGGERFITEKAVHDNSLKIFPKGTVLLTSRAPIGYVAIANKPVTTNQGFKNLIPNENTSSEFVLYLLREITEYLRDISGGSTFSELTAGTLREVKTPCPERKEQRRIGTILSWFDELIENKKKQNEILEKTVMAVFKSWFIDFEPFKKNSFKKSELVEIPSSWSVRPIGEIADIHNGISYSGKEKFVDPVEGCYVFITLNNAVEGGGFKTEYAWIRSDRLKERVFLEEGDLIIPNTEQTKDERLLGSPGIVVFPPDYKQKKGVFSHHISKISPYDMAFKFYLYLFLKATREDTSSFHTGTGVLGLDIKNFKKNKLLISPAKPILEKFHVMVEPLFHKTINNQKEIMVLRKTRDTLLPLLVFGKLRVEEI